MSVPLQEKVTCPFDKAHTIERRRLSHHIIKCKKNLPANHNFVKCMFYDLHYVLKDNLDEHYKTCEHALQKQSQMVQAISQPSRFKAPKLLVDESVANNFSTESWDDPPSNQPVFNSDALKKNAPHMILPEGMTKSQRREHYEQERKRLRELDEKKPIDIKKEKTGEQEESSLQLLPGTSNAQSNNSSSPGGAESYDDWNSSASSSQRSSDWSSGASNYSGSSSGSNHYNAPPPPRGLEGWNAPPAPRAQGGWNERPRQAQRGRNEPPPRAQGGWNAPPPPRAQGGWNAPPPLRAQGGWNEPPPPQAQGGWNAQQPPRPRGRGGPLAWANEREARNPHPYRYSLDKLDEFPRL